jgi:hypothetical protein
VFEASAAGATVLPSASTTRLIDTILVARAVDASGFRIERLSDPDMRLRLVAIDRDGRELASGWQTVTPGAEFVLGVTDAEDGTRRVSLEGDAWTLTLPLDAAAGVIAYDVRTADAD